MRSRTEVRVTAIDGGPLLVRGADQITDDSGTHEVRRPVVALCRCGHSQLPPWCDGTHKVTRSR